MVLFYCPVDWLPTQECLSTMGRSSVSDSLEPRWLIAHSHCCTFGIIGKLWFQLFNLIWTTWSLKAVWSFDHFRCRLNLETLMQRLLRFTSIFLIILSIFLIILNIFLIIITFPSLLDHQQTIIIVVIVVGIGQLYSNQTVDCKGCVLTPGLVDLHTHLYQYATPLGIDPAICLARFPSYLSLSTYHSHRKMGSTKN